jgi:plasmid stabilization system protein ParE
MQAERAKVVWSPQAQDDLGEVWRWGVAQFSFAAADNHARSIHAAAAKENRPGVREIVIYPTVLLYRVSAEVVEVLRVVDGRRNLAALFPSS